MRQLKQQGKRLTQVTELMNLGFEARQSDSRADRFVVSLDLKLSDCWIPCGADVIVKSIDPE